MLFAFVRFALVMPMRAALVVASTIGFAFLSFGLTGPAHAADSAYDLAVSRTTPYAPSLLIGEDSSSYVKLKGRDSDQEVTALTLDPVSETAKSDTFTVDSAENFDAADWRPIYYLASQYGVLDGRIRDSQKAVKVDAERSAYQIAVWELAAPGVLDSLPLTRVTERARVLVETARAQRVGSRDPAPSRQRLSLNEIQRYPRGLKVGLALEPDDDRGTGPARQLLTVTVDGEQRVARVTDDYGKATVDLPNNSDLYAGKVSAQWLTKLPPGTFLRSPRGQWIVLLDAAPIKVESSNSLNNGHLSLPLRVPIYTALATKWLDTYASSTFGYFVAFVLILGIPSLIWLRAKKLKGLKFFFAMFLAVALCGAAAYGMADFEAREFDPRWTRTNDGEAARIVPTQVLGSSKRTSSRYATAYNWPCVADDLRSTPWVSRPQQGPLETVALDFGEPVQVDELSFIMGWPDSEQDYNEFGKPSRVQLIGQSGQMNEVSIEARDWSSWKEPVVINLDTASRSPLVTQVLYVRTTAIVGGAKTSFGIADLRAFGSPVGTSEVKQSQDAFNAALQVRKSSGCGFQN